jgi:hypothetical protein
MASFTGEYRLGAGAVAQPDVRAQGALLTKLAWASAGEMSSPETVPVRL